MESTLTFVYLPTAILLGALHALEPGHAKTLTAAYLIGIKGTKRDALLLGLSVAATHSVVVIALAATALYLGREAFAGEAMYWLQITSGAIVIGLGAWLLWMRWPRPHHIGHGHEHRHAATAVHLHGKSVQGFVEIVDTPGGERIRLSLEDKCPDAVYHIEIYRNDSRTEMLALRVDSTNPMIFESESAPREPHEFDALLVVENDGEREAIAFVMHEPDHDHSHNHDHLSDDEHARAHAATMPDYVRRGERPALFQIVAFGAAGGMIPCPASVTVMLLAISIGQTGMGILTVLGFSLGLAITLVGVGIGVVLSLRAVGQRHQFDWVSHRAPAISAAVVMLSGVAVLTLTLFHTEI